MAGREGNLVMAEQPFSAISKLVVDQVKELTAEQRLQIARAVYPEGVEAMERLVRQNRRAEQKLLADELTGLPNRNAFDKAVAALENPEDFGYAVFDVDGLKGVNDALSHAKG